MTRIQRRGLVAALAIVTLILVAIIGRTAWNKQQAAFRAAESAKAEKLSKAAARRDKLSNLTEYERQSQNEIKDLLLEVIAKRTILPLEAEQPEKLKEELKKLLQKGQARISELEKEAPDKFGEEKEMLDEHLEWLRRMKEKFERLEKGTSPAAPPSRASVPGEERLTGRYWMSSSHIKDELHGPAAIT